jgi:SOS-response transcriptional repressor LexA
LGGEFVLLLKVNDVSVVVYIKFCSINLVIIIIMTEKEIEKITKILEDAGWQPHLCDTPIPAYESVHAGHLVDPGQIPPGMTLVPKAFLKVYQESMVRVIGNSMLDRGIEDGDWVRMTYGQQPHDGDIVVVAIGNECTLKCYYEDDDGSRWLLSQNEAEKELYKPIRLDEDLDSVYLCGVVTEISKPLPRVPVKNMRSLVSEAKANLVEEPRISVERVRCVIKILGKEIKVARQWYAVCRSMMDELVFDENDFGSFCDMVKNVLPSHHHLPKVAEMQTMAVESFAKPVCKWEERRAPVRGKRFKVYKTLADKATMLLTMSEAEFQEL